MNTLILTTLWGTIGAGYALYGKKQRALVPLVCGVLLMFVPGLLDSAWTGAAVGVFCCVLPWVWRP